jgi:hypothetical protein
MQSDRGYAHYHLQHHGEIDATADEFQKIEVKMCGQDGKVEEEEEEEKNELLLPLRLYQRMVK